MKYAFSGRALAAGVDEPAGKHPVPAGFFGLCVAGSDDPAGDDYIVERLKELGLSHVRVDFSYESPGKFQERFLRRLIDEHFRVCLHLVQPRAEAAGMHANEEARNTWREFLAGIYTSYGRAVELIEIGSTCNRRKWSGYTLPSYLAAWRIAREMAISNNYPLAAPNVTDFEPVYNMSILNEIKQSGNMPAAHTDNLFVERAGEPEAFDPKIAGKLLAGVLRFNLVRKARALNQIGRDFGVEQTICSHVSWSLRRIERFLEDSEEKQADYLARYYCLAAASGALERVYWGPLIGQREGLIDDGTSEFPEIPHVTYYACARGKVQDYRLRPAFFALRTAVGFIAGTTYVRKIKSEPGLEIHEFLSPAGSRQVAWTVNGRRVLTRECYPAEALKEAACFSRDGKKLDAPPAMITESPVYIEWTGQQKICLQSESVTNACPEPTPAFGHPSEGGDLKKLENNDFSSPPWRGTRPVPPKRFREGGSGGWVRPDSLHNIRFAQVKGMEYDFITRNGLCGVCQAGRGDEILNLIAALGAGKPVGAEVLRDARNRVWRLPQSGETNLVIKMFKPPGLVRRWLARRKGDKAVRSWNGAQELLRRGISTPRPIAFFHQADRPLAAPSWYVCGEFAGAHSAREAFNAFSASAAGIENISSGELYNRIALFLRKMHDRGIYFRDLSAGNLLFRPGNEGEIEFALIDTARAAVHDKSLGLWRRLCDLMRICHPLCRAGRRQFIAKYLGLVGRRYHAWLNLPFHYYDLKHWMKGQFRRRRK